MADDLSSLPDIQTDPLPRSLDGGAYDIANMPTSMGDVFGASTFGGRVLRRLNAEIGAQGIDPSSGIPFAEPEAPAPAATLQEKYGIAPRADGNGGLTFTTDMPESVARELNQNKRRELLSESIAQRRPPGFWSTVGTLGADLANQATDPLGLLALLVPAVGEARVAAVGGRLALGAYRGIMGTAPYALGSYGFGKLEQSDQTIGDALLSIGLGGGLGALLHAPGALSDLVRGRYRSSPARLASGADALVEAPVSTREAALRTSLAQVLADCPVEVTPLFTGTELGGVTRSLADLDAEAAAELKVPAQDAGLQRDLEIIRGNAPQPAPAQSLVSALREVGPIADPNGELKSLGLTNKSQPGLISKTGASLDDVANALWERGWIGTPGGERPSISDLLSAVHEDQHGAPRVHPSDLAAVEERQRLAEFDQALYERGIDLRSMSNRDAELALSGKPAEPRPVTLEDRTAEDAAFRQAAGERFVANVRRDPLPDQVQASRVADAAVKEPATFEAPKPEDIATVRASLADAERFMLPEERAELQAADGLVARAQAAAKGFAQAAICIARGGM